MAALASAGPATKARNSRPSPCLRVTKLPFSAKDLSSSAALTLKTNIESESTKRLKNFIEFPPRSICRLLNLNRRLASERSPNSGPCGVLHRTFVRSFAAVLREKFPHRVTSTMARIGRKPSDTWSDPQARPHHCQTESDPGRIASNRLATCSLPDWRQNISQLRPTKYRDMRCESQDR